MIFTIGAIAAIFGWVVLNFMGSPMHTLSPEDVIGVILIVSGLAGMLSSLLVLAWQHLP